jgi:diguanylate cyclase (GGDEF)-like protein/putative nucleotidyltransferase with HDIG domain
MKDLPIKAKIFISATMLLALASLIPTFESFDFADFWLTIALCVITSLTQVVKVEGPTDKSSFNLSWVLYGFSLLLLGVPQTVIIVVVSHIVEWIWHKYQWVIQIFNVATHSIVLITSGLVLDALEAVFDEPGLFEVPIILIAFVAFTILNHLWIGLVIKFARGQGLRESGVLSGYSLILDFTLLCLGGATAYIWAINPIVTILNIVPLYLIYTTLKVPALQRKTDTDQKTGLFNSRFFSESVEKELSRSNRFKRPLTVVMTDLDFLRNINNKYGHIAGDEVIIELANILNSSFRDYDIVSRFGGEEFAVLMPETVIEEALPRVEMIRKRIEQHGFVISTSAEPIQVTMSFGVAERDGDDQTKDQLLHNADKALYRAKVSGRNRVVAHRNGSECSLSELDIPVALDPVQSQEGPEQRHPEYTQKVIQESDGHSGGEANTPVQEETVAVDTQTHPNADKQSQWHVKLFVGAMVLMVAVLLLLVGINFRVDWYGLGLFAALAIFAEALSIDIYVKKRSVSTSAAPFVASLLLYGPIAAVVIGVSIAVVAWIKNRSPLYRLLFNISNHVIGGLLCSIVALLVKDQILVDHVMLLRFLDSLIFGGLLFLSTTLLISSAISIDKGVSIRIVWTENYQWLGPIYMGMGILGYALVLGYRNANILGVAAITVPIMILRFSQIQYVDRTKKLVKKLKATNKELYERSDEVDQLNAELLQVLGDVIDLRDPYVLGHSQNVAESARRLAEELGLSSEQINATYQAGILHDLGKIGIPEEILQKPGKLTKQEYEVIKKHPEIAAMLVARCHALQHLVPIVRHHHEKFDGTGYPDGLKGEEIPVESRIISMMDVVEAMSSDRPYRAALEPHRVIEEVKRMSGEYLDPQVVDVFLNMTVTEGHLFFQNSAIEVYEKVNGGAENFYKGLHEELVQPLSVGGTS